MSFQFVDLSSRSSYTASEGLRKTLREKYIFDHVLHFAYTDYGGDFFDKVVIEYFEKNHPDSIVSEDTVYSGKNAFVFGDLALEFKEASDNYLLGFRDLEEYYSMREDEEKQKGIDSFLADIDNTKFYVSKNAKERIDADYAMNITTQGADYSDKSLMWWCDNRNLIVPLFNTDEPESFRDISDRAIELYSDDEMVSIEGEQNRKDVAMALWNDYQLRK